MMTTDLDAAALGVFMGSDGAICHAVCWRPLEYLGVRGGIDVDFYCPGCVEHLSLPVRRVPGIPMRGPGTGATSPGPDRAWRA